MKKSESESTLPNSRVAGSFRDPSGFLFIRDGTLLRQVNQKYEADYNHLLSHGLYQHLIDAELLIPHQEVGLDVAVNSDAYKIIKPEVVPFISYPYEWCFSQLKDAALTTLEIQRRALDHDMSLKDGSAYNIQFSRGKPLLIDTLSFEMYQEGAPWVAYRQFCQHFLAPLALVSYTDVRLSQLLRSYIDGIPLDLAARLLPFRSRFNLGLLLHIHVHSRSQSRFADAEVTQDTVRRGVSRRSLMALIDNLSSAVKRLKWNPNKTMWANYYQGDSYKADGLRHKESLVSEFVETINPQNVWDLGANTGNFSRIASQRNIPTIAWDIDPGAVELNYRAVVTDRETDILPLILDLTNPSPAIGWANHERESFLQRGKADAVFALALIHHLAIANNVPLIDIARLMAELGNWLIIEFVPKRDAKVKKLLASREDIFPNYTQHGFEEAFANFFSLERSEPIRNSERLLYLMKKE